MFGDTEGFVLPEQEKIRQTFCSVLLDHEPSVKKVELLKHIWSKLERHPVYYIGEEETNGMESVSEDEWKELSSTPSFTKSTLTDQNTVCKRGFLLVAYIIFHKNKFESMSESFTYAVISGNERLVDYFLSKNQVSEHAFARGFNHAARCNSSSMILHLLRRRLTISVHEMNLALEGATYKNQLGMVHFLMNDKSLPFHPNEKGVSCAIRTAAFYNHCQITRYFLLLEHTKPDQDSIDHIYGVVHRYYRRNNDELVYLLNQKISKNVEILE